MRVTQSEVYATTVNFRTVVFDIDFNAASSGKHWYVSKYLIFL